MGKISHLHSPNPPERSQTVYGSNLKKAKLYNNVISTNSFDISIDSVCTITQANCRFAHLHCILHWVYSSGCSRCLKINVISLTWRWPSQHPLQPVPVTSSFFKTLERWSPRNRNYSIINNERKNNSNS